MGKKIKLVVSSLCIFQWVATLFGMAYSSTTPMVRDLDRSPVIMVLSCPETALSDFNASHFNNRILLHPEDSEEDLAAAAAAVSPSLKSVWRTEFFLTDTALNLKNLKVQASTEPQASLEADGTVGTGEKAQVTVISFATCKSVTFYQSSNFFRIANGNSSRENTISTVDQTFRWREMSKDLFWIRTNATVNGLTSTSSPMFDSKQAVLGQRSCVRVSTQLEHFSGRWRRNFQQHNPAIDNPLFNVTVKRKDVTGYGIDIFMANLKEMSSANVSGFAFSGKPIKEMAATYNGLMPRFYAETFHTAVGDVTVINCTLPFKKSDPTEDDCCSWEVKHLLVYIYFFVFIGSVVWILVKLVNDDFGSQTHEA